MPQVFLGVDFIQAFNPLYALPIVAVVLCAFLVYAFGFKSPLQPPSFDEIEIDKKPAKRRKVKENSKIKQQNGKLGSSSLKVSENVTTEKKKPERLPTEKKMKADKASKKLSYSSQMEKALISQEHSTLDDENGEGWVHLVSKKGRKNRKKDEVSSNMDAIQAIPLFDEIVMDISDKDSENCVPEDTFSDGKKIDTILIDDTLEKKDTKKPVPSKKKSKKKDKEVIVVNEVSNIPNELISTGVMHIDGEKAVALDENLSLLKEKKPSKKKKKKHEGEKEVIHSTEKDLPSSFSNETSKIDLPPACSEKVHDKVLKVENIMGVTSLGNTGVNDANRANCIGDGSVEAKGVNVAFDELEGLYPDSKPQKKKKKVRREH